MDARLSSERPDAVASKRTSTARMPAGVIGVLLQPAWPIDLGASKCDTLLHITLPMGTLV